MRRKPTRAIRPNMFGIAFGIAGLAETWRASGVTLHISPAVANSIDLVAAVIWIMVLAAYAAQGPRQLLADLRDKTVAPFVPLASITALLLAAALSAYAFEAGRALVVVFVIITIAVGGWMTGQWIAVDLDQDAVHPGYFLPTVAGGLVAALASAEVHLRLLAESCFGIGILCWLVLGSLLLNRLFFRPSLPAALFPTLAIEVAPPAVAGIAYNAISGGASDGIAYGLAGYAILMLLVQLRLLPFYVRLPFGPGFWAFTFSYAATATDAIEWISRKHPAGASADAAVILGAITLFMGSITVRTIIAIGQDQFFPRSVPPPGAEATATSITA